MAPNKKNRWKYLLLVAVLVAVLVGAAYFSMAAPAGAAEKKKEVPLPAILEEGVNKATGLYEQGKSAAEGLLEQAKDVLADFTIDLSGATATQDPQ